MVKQNFTLVYSTIIRIKRKDFQRRINLFYYEVFFVKSRLGKLLIPI